MDQQICLDNCRRLQDISDEVARETASNREVHKDIFRRLGDLEASSREQNQMLVTMQKQADAIESMNGKIDIMSDSVSEIARRVSDIEREPADRWKKITYEVIKCVVVAAVGAALAVAFGI